MSSWFCHGCGKRIYGLKPEHCNECHETFGGTKAGDMHRVGSYATTNKPSTRRCLTPDEMRSIGLAQNEKGYWIREYGVKEERGT